MDNTNSMVAQVQQQSGGLMAVEQSRAVQEVQAALIIAKRFPRDEFQAIEKIRKACQRFSLAECAMYSFPRGGQTVSGPSVHLLRSIAKTWGNLVYGTRVLSQDAESTTLQSYAWDKESNTENKKEFIVRHEIKLKNGDIKYLTDPRDIYEMCANMGARRERACLEAIVPEDVVADALAECKRTIQRGEGGVSLVERIRRMISVFGTVGVTQEMLEQHMRHPIKDTTEKEIVEYTGVFQAIKDGADKFEFFAEYAANPSPTTQTVADPASGLFDGKPATEAPAPPAKKAK